MCTTCLLARPEIWNVVVGFTALVVSQTSGLAMPWGLGLVVDSMMVSDDDIDVDVAPSDGGQHTMLVIWLRALFSLCLSACFYL